MTSNTVDPVFQVMPWSIADGPFSVTGDPVFPLPTQPRPLAAGDVMWIDSGINLNGYVFDLHGEEARSEVIRYIHRNPVKRGLVASPEQYPWSSFNHYATGIRGAVEIESEWTARLRGPLIAIKLR